MNRDGYIKFSNDQLEKIGYTSIYLCNKIPYLSKTKLLKLLYILDEISIKKTGIPFLNLKYKVWKFGAVAEEIFIDLSSEITLLSKYIEKDANSNSFKAKIDFSDDEFSDNDLQIMDDVIEKFGKKTTKELIDYTHREKSLWYNAAKKHSVLELLQKEEISNTDFLIDMSLLIAHDNMKKDIYLEYIETH